MSQHCDHNNRKSAKLLHVAANALQTFSQRETHKRTKRTVSGRLSVTCRYCVETAKRIIGILIILVCSEVNGVAKD